MSERLDQIIHAISASADTRGIEGLKGSARGLVVSTLAHQEPDRTLLVITASAEGVQELLDDCRFFLHPDQAERLRAFPESSVLPYSRLSPEPESWADRLAALYELTQQQSPILITTIQAIMRRVPPSSFIANGVRTIRTGEMIDAQELAGYLVDMGYEDVGLVEDEGSFARRGGIIDIWPPTSHQPFRLELDGDVIFSMRFFEPASQRSRQEAREVLLIPVRDIPFDAASRAKAAHRIRERSDTSQLTAHDRRALIEAIHEGIAVSGIETFLPLFHENTAILFDYLPKDARIVLDDPGALQDIAKEHATQVSQLAADTQSPERIIHQDEIMLSPNALWDHLNRQSSIHFNPTPLESEGRPALIHMAGTQGNADLRSLIMHHEQREDMLAPLARRINALLADGWNILFSCHTEVQSERLKDLFHGQGIELHPFELPFDAFLLRRHHRVQLKLGRLSAGFRWEAQKIALITDAEMFGTKSAKRALPSRPLEPFTSLAEIAEGDYLVHEQHGIGRYLGLKHLTIDGLASDFLLMEYLGGDKLYLPVYRMNLIGRYIGAGTTPPLLDKLGGLRWANVQKRVTAAIRLLAKELLDIYAARQVYPGIRVPPGGSAYEEFEAAFPFDETPDQLTTIGEIMRDMDLERPMDRLVCGDVGYGKTEVAMRAAFRAAMAGLQVAVLVPTTVLAFQHAETFQARFAETPLTIDMLSRFRSHKEAKAILEKLKQGTVDIIIGTHRLLQKDIVFRNLGLLIIDEEHRFGVRHKERIKKLRSTVDVISMSATPIPRTLNMSLAGVRDISIINTPPADRHSITTYVAPFDEGVVRQAILREIARGGQVFFVHNRVETIESMRVRLARLVPEARIVVGHGKLKERQLEDVMLQFIEKKADVLLCTTIIESGLDIPSANTIIVHRADTFGLAQLYQLRGRVGRSTVRASAYLLTPPDGTMTPIAKKRLTVLKRFTELGSGFQIAMHDLEFRGSGNILGSAQSGHIAAVGYELFTKLLDRTVRKLMGKQVEQEIDPELNLKVAAFLPESYLEDPGVRIDTYKRLASRNALEEIEAMREELSDRFGPLPREAEHLIGIMEVKVIAKELKMRQVLFDGRHLSCQLDAASPLGTEQILHLTEEDPERYRIAPPDRLIITLEPCSGDTAIIRTAKNSLSALTAYVSEKHL